MAVPVDDIGNDLDDMLEVLEREQREDEQKMKEKRRAAERERILLFHDVDMLDDHSDWLGEQETTRAGGEGQEDLHMSREEEDDPKTKKASKRVMGKMKGAPKTPNTRTSNPNRAAKKPSDTPISKRGTVGDGDEDMEDVQARQESPFVVPPSASSSSPDNAKPRGKNRGTGSVSTLSALQKVTKAVNKREREIEGGRETHKPGYKLEVLNLPPTTQVNVT